MFTPLVLSLGSHSLTKLIITLKKKCIYFNWRIIALQYCAHFCQTSTWINHRYTHAPSGPPHTPSHLSRWSQSSGFELPASDSTVMHAFQCHSLHSSCPFLPALCPEEVCSLCLLKIPSSLPAFTCWRSSRLNPSRFLFSLTAMKNKYKIYHLSQF